MSLFDRRIRHANGPFVIQASENTYEIVPQPNIAEYAVGNLTVYGNLFVKRFGLPDWTVDKYGAYPVDQGGTGHTSIDFGKFLVGNATGQLIVTSDMTWTGAVGLEVGRLTVENQVANVLHANTAFVEHLQAIESFMVPVGNTATRPDPPNVGHMRFNVDTSSYEGFVGTSWGSLGGVKDVDGDSYVAAEFNPGSNDNNLRFVTGGTEWMRVTGNGNVAIGQVAIDNPRADLHVSGTTLLANLLANVATVYGNLYANIVHSRDVHVTGNLIVEGNTIAVNQEFIETQNPRIVLNKSATGFYNENTTIKSGVEIYRGTLEPYLFVFDEPTDLFKIGTEDSLQAVATRRDTVVANTIPFWNASIDSYDYDANLRLDNGTLVAGKIAPYESGTQDLGSQATKFRDLYLSNAIISDTVLANTLKGDGFFVANVNPENVNGTVSVLHGGTGRDSLTANLVLVGNAQGPVASASGLYFANERLGIRTSSPTEALDVSGNVHADMFIGDGSLLANFTPSQIPSLDASKITTGILPVALGGTGVTAKTGTGNVVLSDSPTLRGLLTIDGNIAIQGTPPFILSNSELNSNLNADLLDGQHGSYYLDLTNATGTLSNVQLPTIDASWIVSGTLDAMRVPILNASHVPALDASYVSSGTLVTARIPSLDASFVTSGVWDAARIPLLNASHVPALDASFVLTGTVEGARIPLLNASHVPSLDASYVASGTLGTSRIPALDASFVTSGTLGISRVPALDASYVASGTLGTSRIPSLDASFVTSGVWDAARIPLLNASHVPALDASFVSTGTVEGARIPLLNASHIPSLDASYMFSGTLGTSRIPSLDASFVTSGTLGISRVPALDASYVASGTLGGVRIPLLNASQVPSLDASFVFTGTLGTTRIPSLDASFVTTGTLGTSRIPSLDASFVTTGTLGAIRIPLLNASHVPALDSSFVSSGTLETARIPALDASYVSSGVLNAVRIPLLNASQVPSLDASYVSSGTIGTTRIPALDASFISSGTLSQLRVPSLDASWTTSGTFAQARIPSLDASWVSSGTLGVPYGGTGRATLTANRLLVGNNANAVNPATNLYWDHGTSRLGINTVAPSEALEVDGTVKADFFSGDAAFLSNIAVSSLTGTIPVSAGGTGRTTLTSNRLLVGNNSNAVDPVTNLYWDRVNSRLGINNILPSTALDITGSLTVSGNIIVSGDMSVLGNTTTLNTETVLVEDTILVLNAGLTGVPPSNLISGIEVERGTETNYQFVFEESTDLFKVGLANDLQAVATRADVVSDKTVAFWNATEERFDYDANVTIESSVVRARSFVSNIATGSAPFIVASNTLVANLNADLLDGQDGAYYLNASNINVGTLSAARIPALDASFVSTGTLGGARIPQLNASQIPALDASFVSMGTLGVARIPQLNASQIPALDASFVSTGTLGGARIPQLNASQIPAHDASFISTGTFLAARIPALDASYVSSGTLAGARIPLLNASQVPALNASQIVGGVLDASEIPALDASWINAGVFAAARIPTGISITGTAGGLSGAINASWIVGGVLDATEIPALNASWITTGVFDAAEIPLLNASHVSSLDAGKITSGTFAQARIPALDASWITAGTFAVARIPALDASWITAGTFNAARIPTLNQSTTGNAATATTLQTARNINGTSFNGSADITTANWGTARTLTIGGTGKSVNGSGDVSWSLAEIGAAASSHTHNISGITDANRWWNNFGDNHTTRTDFNATYDFGWRFVQGSTNGPGVNSASQYYSVYVGLGNDLPATGANSYGMQVAYPRNVSLPYIAIRYRENNAWGSWNLTSAGRADVLTTARTFTIGSTGRTFDGSGNVTWSLADIGAAATGQTMFIGTTSVAINRGSGALSLTGVSIDGNAGTVTNGVYTTGAQTIAGTKTFSSAPVVSHASESFTFNDSGTSKRGIIGTCGGSDQWFFGGGATASNAGFLEISTGDDSGTEPIYVRQYQGGSPLTGTVTRTLTLLDGSGNTSFPGTVSGTFSGNATTATTLQTARTFTIGSTGRSFNGSGNVSWSLADIGAAATGQTMFIGTTSVAINRASAAITLTGTSIDGNAGTAGGLSVHSARNNEANKIVRTDANGYIQAGWINTTSGDSGNTVPNKFYSSNDDYIRYYTRNTFKMHLGLTAKYDRGRVQDSTDSNYWTGNMGWAATDLNAMVGWGAGFTDSWGTAGTENRPSDGASHHVGLQTFHYTAGTGNSYGWQMVMGGGTARWWLKNHWGAAGSWNEIVTNSGTWGINVTGSSGSCTGNAGTATTLQTARTINGTSFNGSANITTANWGTARTLTIGSTGKSVNGSGNVSWSLAELGAAATGQTMFIGTTSVAINRGSGALSLTGVSIDGNAGTVTNGVYTTGDQDVGGTKKFTGRVNIQPSSSGGGQNLFNGLEAVSSANGRAQLVLSSAYSDIVIASSQANTNHGSTLSFVTYNPSNASDYRKMVIGQANWGGSNKLYFGYGSNITNPHNAYSASSSILTVDGDNRRVGVDQPNPSYKLHVAGDIYANGGWLRASGEAGLYAESYGAHFRPNWDQYGNWKIHGNAINGWNGLHFSDSGLSLMCNSTGCGFHRNGDGWRLYVENNDLYVRGNITAYWSDARLKKDLREVKDADDIIDALTAYRFKWNEKGQKIIGNETNDDDIGLIAQTVQTVLPQAVKVNRALHTPDSKEVVQEDYLTIDYDKLTPVCIQAIKNNKMRIDCLERENAKLREENMKLRADLDRVMSLLGLAPS